MDPATTETMKVAAPSSSPMASEPEPDDIAEKVEKTSGEPLPRAKKVTPAVLSFMPNRLASVPKFGQKKSLATSPRQLKRKAIHIKMTSMTPMCWKVNPAVTVSSLLLPSSFSSKPEQ